MKGDSDRSRRDLLLLASTGGLALSGALRVPPAAAEEGMEKEVSAALMNGTRTVDSAALADAATLFREFGEQYHEQTLEERFVFPAVKQAGGDASRTVDVLIAQHRRGQEITDYILGTARQGSIGAESARSLAAAMHSMVRMYRSHAAREDTVIFPAWKSAVTADQLKELAEEFEEIEHKQFGEDGFDKAVERITRVEQMRGLADLVGFTAPPPPASR